ncbi:hypothetical protein HK096_004989 [Nowakowskiella sp. JEL0078]|nr:hypothetical protein HK096_004989 [Nowakowskiella sp. JEL0078]
MDIMENELMLVENKNKDYKLFADSEEDDSSISFSVLNDSKKMHEQNAFTDSHANLVDKRKNKQVFNMKNNSNTSDYDDSKNLINSNANKLIRNLFESEKFKIQDLSRDFKISKSNQLNVRYEKSSYNEIENSLNEILNDGNSITNSDTVASDSETVAKKSITFLGYDSDENLIPASANLNISMDYSDEEDLDFEDLNVGEIDSTLILKNRKQRVGLKVT